MSFTVSKIVKFSDILQEIPQNEQYDTELPLLGGLLADSKHIWHAKGPCLEVRNTKSGLKVGGWTFGNILRDSNIKIVCVEELKSSGGLSLLVVAFNCNIKGGVICFFNIFRSKVIRTIEIREKISNLCIIDPGLEVLNLPGPLRDFDGILAVGTDGGKVLLVDICRQICEESINSLSVRDEANPSQLVVVIPNKISKIEQYRERAIRDGDHLAIFLNIVVNSQTEHFTLKGPKGEDRIHVNSEEVATSALYYCNQLTSLLVGFNFGAFQLWNLTNLELVYTSHICEEHIPITNFALQEPTDDPKAFCYIWVSYSNTKLYHTGLPFAVMYSFCYDSKEYHDGYGYLYENFQSCSVRFQVELGPLDERFGAPKGGYCLGLQPVYKQPSSKDPHQLPATGDTLALCVVSWSVWYSKNNVQNYSFIFDLNQWYKEQMPNFTKWGNSNNFILKLNLSDMVPSPGPCLSCLLNPLSLRQFIAVQRLEEHFCPTSLTFDLWILRETEVVLLHNEGVQKFLLNQIQTAGSLCLIRPSDICHKIISLGLTPLFVDITSNNFNSIDFQREIIFNVALEHHLISWLYNCATGWANGGFSSTGCSLDFLLNWAFQRAIVLKTNCDKYCAPLFDYSQTRLDHNTSLLLNSCTGQINVLCKFYFYVITNLSEYVSCIEIAAQQRDSLEMVAVYFEVLQWLVNVGLLPESHPASYPKPDISERISAPYPVQELTEYYTKKRAQLQLLSKERFASTDSLLFIDNLITYKCGAELLQKQWQEDEGTGLYPPPSLQSLLRTYLVPGTSICHKHSLVIYLFLDLAMMLDQSQYSPVITYLIKFPAVFKVTSSIIKITQAFWQLDHGDYNTAIEQLLDPFVLNEDLQPWHHTIAMRSLLLQNQHNAALLYMEVRKPPILDDNDILTAVSLYITNNMLSEAFYFLKGRSRDKEEKFLMHLFKECDKNETLHALLYKCLNTSEEKTFLKYLSTAQNPTANDLQIFYFLLRARFLEAFDMHTNLRKKKPESQGLIGQRNATQTDQIVKIFKTLLPDINSNLVKYIRKERANLWKEVPKPTPLSVFVHNTREQVHYKSTVIHAAISKAKNTFMDSMNGIKFNDIETEDTPFLRTPTAFKLKSRLGTPIITPKVIELDENGDELSPTPPKRIKLSPRAATTSSNLKRSTSLHSRMLTPVVKRKPSLTQDYSHKSNIGICTPQSILKVRSLVMANDNHIDDTFNDEDFSRIRSSPVRNSSFGLLPRRSVSRTTQHVQFKDAAFFSSSLSDQSSRPTDSSNLDDILPAQSLSSRDISMMVSSKDSSTSHDDVFYSPNSSENERKTQDITKPILVEDDQQERLKKHEEPENDVEMKDDTKMEITNEEQVVLSPRARRSYKRSHSESTPVRSSPRLSRRISKEPTHESLNTEEDSNEATNDIEELNNTSKTLNQSPRSIQKPKGRRPLSRQVLEHNTFSKMYQSSPLDVTVSKEISLKQSEKITVLEKSLNSSDITNVETSLNITDISTTGTPISSKHHTTSTSFSKSRISEITVGSSTSTLSDYNFSTDSISDITIPEILLNYLNKAAKVQEDQPTLQDLKEDAENVETRSPEKDKNMRKAESIDEEKINDTIGEEKEDEMNSSKKDEKDDEMNLPKKEEESFLADPVVNKNEDDEQNAARILSEVYEDLSSGSEDIAEVLNASKQKNTSRITDSRNESDYLPTSEIGFLADESKNELSVDKSVIVISSDEESSSKSTTSSNSDNSLSGNETDDLNVSYEHNIHIEENSRSLADSNRSSDASSSSDIEERVEPMDEEEDIPQQQELEINEDDEPADWMNDETESSSGGDVQVAEQLEENREMDNEVAVVEENNEVLVVEPDNDEVLPENVSQSEVEIVEIDNEKEQEVEEEKKYADLKNYSPQMPHSSFQMEQPTYLQGFPLDDQELFAGTLIKDLATETQDISKNIDTNYEQPIPLIEEPADEKEFDGQLQEEQTSPFVIESSDLQELGTEIQEAPISRDKESVKEEETVVHAEKIKETSNLKDQSTNTTFVTFVDENVENKSLQSIDKPEEQDTFDTDSIKESPVNVTKHTNNDIIRKAFALSIQKLEDDENSSSSDTTEGAGLLQQEITVTAQIHTPNQSSIQDKNDPIQSDLKHEENVEVISEVKKDDPSVKEPVSIDLPPCTKPEDTLLPGVRTRKTLSVRSVPTENRSTRPRKTTRSEQIDCEPSDSKETVNNSIIETLLTKTRSNSVDKMKTYSRKRSLRSSSVDEEITATKKPQVKPVRGRSRALSTSNLPSVQEESVPKGRRRSGSTMEEYASSRRLTRRQAGMLKGIPTPTDITVEDDSDMEVRTEEDDFDPIKLLDKPPFEGKPDPEEKKIYEESSPSTSTVSSFVKPSRRLSRSASATSDTSMPPSASQASPVRKSTRKTKTESTPEAGVRTRSRKQSETSSVVSEKSDSSTPPKKTRSRRGKSVEVENTVSPTSRTTRSKVSSTKSESPKSKTSARRRIVSTKSDLPEIVEEKPTESAHAKETRSKKRKKSH